MTRPLLAFKDSHLSILTSPESGDGGGRGWKCKRLLLHCSEFTSIPRVDIISLVIGPVTAAAHSLDSNISKLFQFNQSINKVSIILTTIMMVQLYFECFILSIRSDQ